MAIQKKLIHFKTFSNFNSKKLSANETNTQYTLGVGGTVTAGSPDILYQSICWIKDEKKMWTHGTLYELDSSKVQESLDNLTQEVIDNEEVVAAALNDLQENKASKTYVDEAVASAGGGSDDIYVFEPINGTPNEEGNIIRGTLTLEEYEKIVNCRVLRLNLNTEGDFIFTTKLAISESVIGFATMLSGEFNVVNLSCIFAKSGDIAGWEMRYNNVFTFKTINGESIVGEGDITIEGGSSDANVQAVDTGDVLDDVNVDYATKAYVDGLIGDINSVLESIINS